MDFREGRIGDNPRGEPPEERKRILHSINKDGRSQGERGPTNPQRLYFLGGAALCALLIFGNWAIAVSSGGFSSFLSLFCWPAGAISLAGGASATISQISNTCL